MQRVMLRSIVEMYEDKWLSSTIDDCINNVLFETNLCRQLCWLCRLFFLQTHSLCCGLEEYRQLRWLTFTFIHSSSPIGLHLCNISYGSSYGWRTPANGSDVLSVGSK